MSVMVLCSGVALQCRTEDRGAGVDGKQEEALYRPKSSEEVPFTKPFEWDGVLQNVGSEFLRQ